MHVLGSREGEALINVLNPVNVDGSLVVRENEVLVCEATGPKLVFRESYFGGMAIYELVEIVQTMFVVCESVQEVGAILKRARQMSDISLKWFIGSFVPGAGLIM